MNALVEEHSSWCDFVFVYIEEAHAHDEWPIALLPAELSFAQHTDVSQRASAAMKFVAAFPLHPSLRLFVDSFESDDQPHHPRDSSSVRAMSPSRSFNATFASWPFRWWAFDRGVVAVKAMPRNTAEYDVRQLASQLRELKNTRRRRM